MLTIYLVPLKAENPHAAKKERQYTRLRKETNKTCIAHPARVAETTNLVPLGKPTMTYNTTETPISNRPYTLECQVRDGGGALEEPYVGVRSAHVRPGNTRTGCGPSGLAIPAQVNETPYHGLPEAEDAASPGRGSGESETIPFGSLNVGEEETPDDISTDDESDDESDDVFLNSEDEADPPEQMNSHPRGPGNNTRKKRPGFKVASLNMRGRQKEGKDKLKMVIDWMQVNNISILALQETHIKTEYVEELNEKYRYLKFYGCGASTSSRGIMFILSESAGTPDDTKYKSFECGRTGMLSLKYGDQTLNTVNVYMPNDKTHQREVLTNLRRALKNETCIKESELIVLGDWNFVEDQVDRSPQHADDRGVNREMTKLKTTLDLSDGWRRANPSTRKYTWEGTSGHERKKIFSRIDRIYVSSKIWQATNEYKIINCDISDHDGTSVMVRDASAPDTGTGERKLNLKIINHKIFRDEALRLLTKLENQLEKYEKIAAEKDKPGKEAARTKRRERYNPQIVWERYKIGIMKASELATQARRKELAKIRKRAEGEIKRAENSLKDCAPEEEEDRRKELSTKKKSLNDHEEESRRIRTDLKDGKWFGVNEKSSKLWFSLNKMRTKGPVIKSLLDPDTNKETNNPENMIEIARNHHSQLQSEPPMNEGRRMAIDNILVGVNRKLDEKEKKNISKEISYVEVKGALTKAPNGKAPGPDGIPNEFWKTELKWREKMKKEKKAKQGEMGNENSKVRPCVAALMTKVLKDIEDFGAFDGKFAEARMGLLYKKKDRRDIQNYRPITLLNTDYKTYTKVLANRLRDVAPNLIHKDQTGFMPGRSIYDQTKIVELMLKWSENADRKGAIVCLDQEKAYDRIDLTYLWNALEAFGFPEAFTARVRNLYTKASTAIRVNGFVSELFDVRRGVRQGDPMSCLLYNLAIEPLLVNIRASPLKGFNINEELTKVLVKAYADDMTVFLGPDDKPTDLKNSLNLFCEASTARFNDSKTEVIPMGPKEVRSETIRTREFNGWEIENEIRIARDGEATRILGSWQGNEIEVQDKWNGILERQMKTMKRWTHLYPSVAGRVLLAKTLVVSLAQYLMTVNGISSKNLTTMERNIRRFIWNGKKGQLAWERAILPVQEGGISAPSVKIRYESIKVGWLKRWWRPAPDRPDWAEVANELVYQSAHQKIERNSVREWIGQTWPVRTRSEQLPTSLKEMIQTAQKYNASISVMRAPRDLRLTMPAFHHPYAKNRNLNTKSRTMKCLQDVHKVKTVGDLITVATADQAECENNRNGKHGCKDKAKELLNRVRDNWNPNKETPQRHNLWHTPRRIEWNSKADITKTSVLYNPDTRTTHDLLGGIRIFGKTQGHKSKKRDPFAQEKQPARVDIAIEPSLCQVTVNTDGSATNNGWENAKAGIGVWYADGSRRNIALKLDPRGEAYASNSRAELGAILETLRQNERDDLIIESDSLSSLKAICKDSIKYEDLNWNGIINADLLKGILIRLRTRPALTEFRWVKGHDEDNYGNSRADALADTGREQDTTVRIDDKEWIEGHSALQDGARLQALNAKHTYMALLKWYTKKKPPILHQEVLDEAKDKIQDATGLRPTNGKLLKSIRALKIPPRIKDHMRCMLTGKIKCGAFWSKVPGHTKRAHCSFCKKKRNIEVIETEQHMWLECTNSGQAQAWETTEKIWRKSTERDWPPITLGLIRGSAALTFEKDTNKDSERIKILISMTIWAIWKSKIKISINDENVPIHETTQTLKAQISNLIRNSWNATCFMEENRKASRRQGIRKLWADERLTNFDPERGPEVDYA